MVARARDFRKLGIVDMRPVDSDKKYMCVAYRKADLSSNAESSAARRRADRFHWSYPFVAVTNLAIQPRHEIGRVRIQPL
jgi:hypothetical protein